MAPIATLQRDYCLLAVATMGCCSAVSLSVAADDLLSMSLSELTQVEIHSSTFFNRSVAESPGSSWVLTQQEIVNSPISYVKDFFEYYVPATTISQQGFTGAASGVRGIAVDNNAKTLFMFNGQSVNQKSHYGYQAGLQSTFYGDVDRIEVINGPGSMLHGSGAINGIVNFISKNGSDYPGVHSSIEFGFKEELAKAEVGYGSSYGKGRDVYLYAGVAEAEGFSPDSFLDFEEEPTTDRTFPVYKMQNNYRLSGYFVHDNFRFQSQYQRVERNRNKQISGVNASSDKHRQRHWQTFWASRLNYDYQVKENTRVEFSLPLEFFDHGVNINSREGDKGGRESHIALKVVLTHEWQNHQFAIGFGSGRRSFDAQDQYFESDKRLLEESLDGDLVEYEVFAEDIWQLTDNLSLLFGVRFDSVNYGDFYEPESRVDIRADDLSATTMRLAVAYQLPNKRTLKASYQEGFRYPDTAYFLYHGLANEGLDNAGLEKLPALKEETVNSYEINYLHEQLNLPIAWEVNLYYNRHKGTLDFKRYSREELGSDRYDAARAGIGWGPGAYTNATGSFDAWGLELVSHWQATAATDVRASYAFSRPRGFESGVNTNLLLANESGDRWASYPEHLFKLALNHQFGDGLKANLTFYYASDVDICVSECEEKSLPDKFHEQPRVRLNAKLKYRYDQQFSLLLSVHNLFQDDGPAVGWESRDGVGDGGGLGDDARRVYLGLEFKF